MTLSLVFVGLVIFAAIVVLVLVLLFWLIFLYNGLVSLKKKVENAWAQIDVQLKRRYDLIPNLVNTVKGYMKHEQETLEKVISARAKAMSANTMQEKVAAEGELGGFLSRLMAVVESYPEIKAAEGTKQLMEELTNTENRIGFARQLYNDLVMQFNTKISQFPANLFAGIFHFQESPLFEVKEEQVREAPKVEF